MSALAEQCVLASPPGFAVPPADVVAMTSDTHVRRKKEKSL
jgi:hypothetical protein